MSTSNSTPPTDEARAGEPRTEAARKFYIEHNWLYDPGYLMPILLAIEREAAAAPTLDLRRLLDAIETMDQKITPYGEREDGTILHYIVADPTWHRVLAAARNPNWAAAAPALDVERLADAMDAAFAGGVADTRAVARVVAAEYARLSEKSDD